MEVNTCLDDDCLEILVDNISGEVVLEFVFHEVKQERVRP